MKILRTKIFNKERTAYANKISRLSRGIHNRSISYSYIKAFETCCQIEENFILIGGVAYGIYAPMRETGDIDVLFRSDKEFEKFKKESIGEVSWRRTLCKLC